MRIAHVIALYMPDFVGGASLVVHRLARLQALRHDVAVFAGRADLGSPLGATRAYVWDGIGVTTVNIGAAIDGPHPQSYDNPTVDVSFRHFLERERPDVVHVHSIQGLGVGIIRLAHSLGIPVIATIHDWWWVCMRLFLVTPTLDICPPRVDSRRCYCLPGYDFVGRRQTLAKALDLVSLVLVPSDFLRESLIANGVDAEKVRVVPNGVTVPATRPEHLPNATVRFLYLGGADNRMKGLPTLEQAWAFLPPTGWQLDLVRVGAHEIGGRRPREVRFLPAIPPERVADTLAATDVLIVPSIMRESSSLVVREALAAGATVVASNSGGPEAVIADGVNGLIFPTGDGAALGRALASLVADRGLMQRLQAGARIAPLTSLESQGDVVEEAYAEVRRRPPTHAAPLTLIGRHDERSAEIGGVLFVSGIDGAPHRYRVMHLIEQLALAGVPATSRYFTDTALAADLDRHRVLVLYRVPANPFILALVAAARARGMATLFSVDDLIFTDVPDTPALRILTAEEAEGWRAGTQQYRRTAELCDAFLGATELLAEEAAGLGLPAFVHRNGVGGFECAVAEEIRRRPSERPNRVRIGYFSGTTTHDLDFATVEPALSTVLDRFPEATLVLGGHLTPGLGLSRHGGRIERLPFLALPTFFLHLGSVDVNIVPLEYPNRFSEAKSEVKYLEAGLFAIPTVATPTAAFRHAIRDGENGLLAANETEWTAALASLVGDPARRRRLGDAALRDVYLRYAPEVQGPTLVAILREVVALAGRSDKRRTTAGSDATASSVHGEGVGEATAAVPAGDATAPADQSSALPVDRDALPLDRDELPLDRDALPRDPAVLAERFPLDVGPYALEPVDAFLDGAELRHDEAWPLLGGHAVGQVFRCQCDGLYRIDVRFGTYGRVNDHPVVFHLRRVGDDGDLVRRVVAARTLADSAWYAFEFPPLVSSAGKEFYCFVTAEDTRQDNYVSIWTCQRPGLFVPSGLHLDHQPRPGALTHRIYALDPGWAPAWERPGAAAESEVDTLRELARLVLYERRERVALGNRLHELEQQRWQGEAVLRHLAALGRRLRDSRLGPLLRKGRNLLRRAL